MPLRAREWMWVLVDGAFEFRKCVLLCVCKENERTHTLGSLQYCVRMTRIWW